MNPCPTVICRSLRRRHAGERGFSMLEMLAVVTIIGIFAAAATPSMIGYLRDRRVAQVAGELAQRFRLARSRAMGRGSAVVFRWDAAHAMPTNGDPSSQVTIREAITAGAGPGGLLPSASCFGPDFSDAGTTSRFVGSFEPRRTRFQPAQTQLEAADGTVVNYAEFCFTPRGRTFVRFAAADAYRSMAEVPHFNVRNTRSSLQRHVILVPNGGARIVTGLQ